MQEILRKYFCNIEIKINNCDIKKNTTVTYILKIVVGTIMENETIDDDIGISYNDSIKAIEKTPKKNFLY